MTVSVASRMIVATPKKAASKRPSRRSEVRPAPAARVAAAAETGSISGGVSLRSGREVLAVLLSRRSPIGVHDLLQKHRQQPQAEDQDDAHAEAGADDHQAADLGGEPDRQRQQHQHQADEADQQEDLDRVEVDDRLDDELQGSQRVPEEPDLGLPDALVVGHLKVGDELAVHHVGQRHRGGEAETLCAVSACEPSSTTMTSAFSRPASRNTLFSWATVSAMWSPSLKAGITTETRFAAGSECAGAWRTAARVLLTLLHAAQAVADALVGADRDRAGLETLLAHPLPALGGGREDRLRRVELVEDVEHVARVREPAKVAEILVIGKRAQEGQPIDGVDDRVHRCRDRA